jgi:hypothetical protein
LTLIACGCAVSAALQLSEALFVAHTLVASNNVMQRAPDVALLKPTVLRGGQRHVASC